MHHTTHTTRKQLRQLAAKHTPLCMARVNTQLVAHPNSLSPSPRSDVIQHRAAVRCHHLAACQLGVGHLGTRGMSGAGLVGSRRVRQ